MPQLILIRHGESEWNRDNRFTGWTDVGLTPRGYEQMLEAAAWLRREAIGFDVAFTSVLSRCIASQWALLEGMERLWIPVVLDWRLNERHYGALTGLTKAAAIETYGSEAVQQWRRSFDVAPPKGAGDGAGFEIIDARYAQLKPWQIPQGESLGHVVQGVSRVWVRSISPALRSGQRVAVTAHGNSLRALIKLVEGLWDVEITHREVPNAAPLVYDLDTDLHVVRSIQMPAGDQRSEIL